MIPKRTVAELILLYETEPSLIDVFCEGPSDTAILKFFAEAINLEGQLSSTLSKSNGRTMQTMKAAIVLR